MNPDGWTYERAGLDLAKYAATMAGIQPLLARTWDASRVVPPPFPPRKGGKGSGGFASLFDFNVDGRYKHPVLVTCTDGVGSKLKLARQVGQFDTVGIDLVAMSVNDLICTGGEPLVFLDYVAMPADDPELTRQLVLGISEGCLQAGCSLVGGETAILPDFYAPGTSTWPASRRAWWRRTKSSTAGRSGRGTSSSACRRAASTRTATAWSARSSKPRG